MAAKPKPVRTLPLCATAESLLAFKQYTMGHPKLKILHEQILRAIREPAGASLLFILGPTGVGKTTPISRLISQVISDLQPQLEQDRERMAIAGIEAEAPIHGNYDFKQHFKLSLKALGEILVDHRLDTTWQSSDLRKHMSPIINTKSNVAALRGALEDSLRRRRPMAFLSMKRTTSARFPAVASLRINLM